MSPVPARKGTEAREAVSSDLDPQGVLASIAAAAPELSERQRSRISALMRPKREDHLAQKLGVILRAQR